MKEFAVKSDSFETAKKFKEEIEAIGFTYVDSFSSFESGIYNDYKTFYFSDIWCPKTSQEKMVPFGFSISSAGRILPVFHLDTNYEAAILYCKSIFVGLITVTMTEIAEWKGCPINLLKIV